MTYQPGTTTVLCELLIEAFPDRTEWPEWCKIVAAIEDNQPDLRDVVEIVTKAGQRQELIERFRRQHPVGRAHKQEHDDNYWRVWTEALSLVWAIEVAGYPNPTFTDDNGKPDFLLAPEDWLESKTIDSSIEEAEFKNYAARAGAAWKMFTPTGLHTTVLKKLEDQLQDSLKKVARQGGGSLVVFYSVWLDGGTKQPDANKAIGLWARQAALRENVRIVIVNRVDWRSPIIDTLTVPEA